MTISGGAGALLLHVFSTFATGGPQVRFAQIANHFGRRWRHAIIAMDNDTACRELLDPALDVSYPAIEVRKGDLPGNISRFRAALRAIRPDTLVTYNWGAIEWAMANRLRLVRQVHVEDGFGPEERSRQIPRRVWTRRLMLRGRTVVVPSQTLLRMATEVWRLDRGRVRYLPNGVDLQRFSPLADGAGCMIGTVAALRAEKNLTRLVRAFAALPEPARLVIVGDGPDRPALERLASELAIAGRVTFAGQVADPAPLYRTFNIFALSSDTEQQPLSLLEAMASGCAVVATDVGDVRAMLSKPNQALTSRIDDEDFARKLAELARDPARQHTLGHANRAHAEQHYAQQTMFDAWGQVFDAAAPST